MAKSGGLVQRSSFCFEFSWWRIFTFVTSFNLHAETIPHFKIVLRDLASFNALFIWKRRKAMWCERIEKGVFLLQIN